MTTVKPHQGGPAAGALLGPAGTIERATARFLERYAAGDDYLCPHLPDLERVAEGQSDGLTIILDGDEAELAAVAGRDGRRYVLLTVAPTPESAGDSANPLLEEPIDGSPAVVWIKDMDGRYLRVNSAYAEQLHIAPGDVCGRTDAELSPDQSIDALRLRQNDRVGQEPLELEYAVAPYGDRPAFAVLRFALRDRDGEPIGTCAVGSPLASARLARSESERLMKIERWSRLDGSAAREQLLREWGLAPANGPPPPPEKTPRRPRAEENGAAHRAALAAERDAAHELARTIATEQARTAELAQALSNAEARLADIGSERDEERSRAQLAETKNAEELAAERQLAEALRAELEAARAELDTLRAELDALRGELDATTGELDTVRGELDTVRGELDTVRGELDLAERAGAERPSREELAAERGRADQAEAASEQAHVEAAATATALDRERAAVEELRVELTAVRGELEHAQSIAAERPAPEVLERERETVAGLREGLRQAQEELEEHQRAAGQRPTADDLDRERATVQSLRDELATVHAELAAARDELERAAQVAAAPDASSQHEHELEHERERAERAEAQLAEQRARAEEAVASAEQAVREAAASAIEADAEHRAVEALSAELNAALEELARSHQNGGGATRNALETSVHDGPAWDASSQRALSAALVGVSEWRDALGQAVKSLGADGGWDAAIAWCPDQRRGMMKCAAMWTPEGSSMGAFETRIWQHRQHVSAAEFADAQDSSEPTFLEDLASAEDAMLKHAAAEGMGSALLLPIRNGLDTVGMLELLSRTVTPPDPELVVSLDGVSIQLGAIAQLLNFAAAPHWHLDRM